MLKNVYDFLKEYEKLCQKYSVSIGGCGCCGSPFINYAEDQYIENIKFNQEKGIIEIGDFFDKKSIDELFEDYFKKRN